MKQNLKKSITHIKHIKKTLKDVCPSLKMRTSKDFKGIVLMVNHLNLKYAINIIIKMHANDKNNLNFNIHNIKIIE